MKLILSTHNVTLTKAIEDHVLSRLEKLQHLDRFAIDARVTLEHDHTKVPERAFCCSVRLTVPGPDLFAEDSESDLYAAIDLVSKKIEQQIRKRQNKFKARKHNEAAQHKGAARKRNSRLLWIIIETFLPPGTERSPNGFWAKTNFLAPALSRPSALDSARLLPPIASGGLLLEDGKVAAVGPAKEIRNLPHEGEIDLGSVAVLPGLINAHCHLDYTDMAGQIESVKLFSDWIKAMLALKAHRGYSDYALSWLRGARMLLNSGVTTVADIEAVPELLPEVLTATPLRVCSLLEITGVRSRRPPAQILQDAVERIAQLPGCWTGLSPHAPYSTTPELLRLAGLAAQNTVGCWQCTSPNRSKSSKCTRLGAGVNVRMVAAAAGHD